MKQPTTLDLISEAIRQGYGVGLICHSGGTAEHPFPHNEPFIYTTKESGVPDPRGH